MFKHKLFLLLFILFFSQFLSFGAFSNQHSSNLLSNSLSTSLPDNNNFVDINAPSGTEKVRSNVLRNGGFEEEDSYGPRYFDYSVTTAGYANSSYRDDVHSGLYAGYISSQGTNQYATPYSNTRSLSTTTPFIYIEQIIYLDVWINTKANPDITHGARTYFSINIQAETTYSLYYYLSSLGIPSNGTYNVYFDVQKSTGSWFNIQRNITYDCEQAFGSFDSSWYITNIFFTARSVLGATGNTILLLDDVSITNSTSYEFLQDNGDFEDGDGDPWSNYRTSPGYVYITSADQTEGSKALNLTAGALYDNAQAYVNFHYSACIAWGAEAKGFYPSQPNNLIINFDWKHSAEEVTTLYQYTRYRILVQNSTYFAVIYYYFDINSETIPFSNQTSSSYMYRHYEIDGFKEDDVWHHFSIDVFTLLETLNLKHLVLTDINFELSTSYDSESRIELLVDAFEIVTYANADPSFDESFHWEFYDPIQGWICPFFDTYTNLTTDAHTGTYALNVSTHTTFGYHYVYRTMYLAIQENLFTDFWWKLDYVSSEMFSYTYIKLTLDDSCDLYYVLGSSASTVFVNSSTSCYYYVENYNQTGVWNNILRSLSTDAVTAFGSAKWNITWIELATNTNSVTAKVTALFDDIYFVRDIESPEISDIELNPAMPQYGESVQVIVGVSDNVGVQSVELHYKIGGASWVSIPMVENVTKYGVQIPAAAWNTFVQYYVVATDLVGNNVSYGSLSDPLSYLVGDYTNPILIVEGPETLLTTHMDLQFNLTGSDPGSGIASFTIEDINGTLYESAIVPATYTWETTGFSNGDYTISFILEDNAGNSESIIKTYTINVSTTKHGGLPINLGIILFCLVFSFIIMRRKRT